MEKVVVIGGGISGLATAYQIKKKAQEEGLEIDLTLVEKDERVGGKIRSVEDEGFLCESGPAAFLDSKPDTLKLSRELGLKPLPANESAKKRFIYSGGHLRMVPLSPKSFLTSNILSLKGRIRVLMELRTKPFEDSDESIAQFGRRHLGEEAEEKLINPMVVGIFAGRSNKLSLKSCFPAMKELEREGGGSLLKAMLGRMKKAKKSGVKSSPTGNLNSFEKGLEEIVRALEKNLEKNIIKGNQAVGTSISEKGYKVSLEKGELEADALILAVPAYDGAELLKNLDDDLQELLGGISYAPAAIVALGYDKKDIPKWEDGFGFLIPTSEDRDILGCRWDSSTFRARAPADNVLLWSIVGGDVKPEIASMRDEELIELVKRELKDIMNIDKDPLYTRIFKHEKAIPQYFIGHADRINRLEKRLVRYPGLFLTGNALKGVGLNDCTRNAKLTSDEVIQFLKGEDGR